MGLVKFSGIAVTEIRGKVGGDVFTRNTAGAIVRTLVQPNFPNTSYQQTQNQNFTEVVQAWQDLTPTERNAWDSAAATETWEYRNKVGDYTNYTGQQLYVKLNLSMFGLGPAITEPPAKPALEGRSLDELMLGITGNTPTAFTASMAAGSDTADCVFMLFATMPLSPGISRPKRKLFRFIQQAPTGDIGSNWAFQDAYAARFGDVNAGGQIFVYTELVHVPSGTRLITGQVGGIIVEV